MWRSQREDLVGDGAVPSHLPTTPRYLQVSGLFRARSSNLLSCTDGDGAPSNERVRLRQSHDHRNRRIGQIICVRFSATGRRKLKQSGPLMSALSRSARNRNRSVFFAWAPERRTGQGVSAAELRLAKSTCDLGPRAENRSKPGSATSEDRNRRPVATKQADFFILRAGMNSTVEAQ